MLEQYTYEPYGALVAAELYYPHAMNRAGHQGLFFERFDGSYDDHTLFRVAQGTAFITGAKGLYYNRNRFYSPSLGRFTTRDPNETALPILKSTCVRDAASRALLSAINTYELYFDGMALYQYAQGNPVIRRDPLGLTSSTEVIATRGITALLFGAILSSAIVADRVGNQLALGLTGFSVDSNGLFLQGIEAMIVGQHALGESLMSSAELMNGLIVMALTQADAVAKAKALWDTLDYHWGEIATGGPDDRNRNKHNNEIRDYIRIVTRMTKFMGRKTAEKWNRWVRDVTDAFENLLKTGGGSPPPMPG